MEVIAREIERDLSLILATCRQAGMMVLFFGSLWLADTWRRVAAYFQNHEEDSSSSFRTTFIYTCTLWQTRNWQL
jgi:hypothetical protein